MRDLSSGPLSLRSLAKLTLRSEFGSQWMWMSEAITTAQARALLAIDSRATPTPPTPPTLTDSPSVAMCAAAEPQGCGWADDRPGLKIPRGWQFLPTFRRHWTNQNGQASAMTARVAGWCLPLVLSVGRAGSLQRGLDVVSGAPVQRWERWQGAEAGLSWWCPFGVYVCCGTEGRWRCWGFLCLVGRREGVVL